MNIFNTYINDLKIIKPLVHKDDRGFFCEEFNENCLKKNIDKDFSILQINHSYSSLGVLRGIHYQKYPYCQKKLIIVISGAIYDVAVDLRKDSKTFKKYYGKILTQENNLQMFIPEGFGHAFLTLSKDAHIIYAIDKPYSPKNEINIRYDDPTININWNEIRDNYIPSKKINLSKKDATSENFKKIFNTIF